MVKVYSLFDRKLREYGALVIMNNDDACRRGLAQSFQNSKGQESTIDQYPEDFDCMCLGSFDPESGVINPETPRLVFNCAELRAKE